MSLSQVFVDYEGPDCDVCNSFSTFSLQKLQNDSSHAGKHVSVFKWRHVSQLEIHELGGLWRKNTVALTRLQFPVIVSVVSQHSGKTGEWAGACPSVCVGVNGKVGEVGEVAQTFC